MSQTNQTTPLARLAHYVAHTEAEVDHLNHRAAIGDQVPAQTQRLAESAEIHARHAFAIACGHRIGTAGFTQTLAQALAEIESGRRPTAKEAAAVFEFVGQWDDQGPDNVTTVRRLRQAAHEFAKSRREFPCQ